MKFVGHDKEIKFFKQALANDKLSSTYIFSGISGIGKKLFAMNIAKALFCEKNIDAFDICDCKFCNMVDANLYPDLYLFNKENLMIDDIRELIQNISLTPYIGKWKVIIMDNADLLSSTNQTPAANSLLKTLEEPTDNTIFFLITDRYNAILPTIRSRSIHVNFAPLKDNEIRTILEQLRPDISYFDTAISLSSGSVSKALDIIDNNLPNISQFIKNKDFIKFTSAVREINDNKKLFLIISNVYPYILDQYKQSKNRDILLLSYYILDILKRLNYNVNMDLIKADFTSKIIEVFSEAV